MPSIVTRPVIASMASAIRLNWRIVVMVISGWRHIKSGRIATMAFVVPPLCAWSPQRYYKSRFRSTSILAKVLYHRGFFEQRQGMRGFERDNLAITETKRMVGSRLIVQLDYGPNIEADIFEW